MGWVMTVLNLLAMGASLWLGFYIVTRSPRRRVSWLAASALWAIAVLFLHRALAAEALDLAALLWLRPVAVFGLPLWYHMILLLAPPKPGRLATLQRQVLVPLFYGLTALLIAGGAFPLAATTAQTTGPRFLHLLAFVLIVSSLSTLNLWRGYRQASESREAPLLRPIFRSLLVTTAVACLGGVGLGLSVWLQAHLASFPAVLVFLFNLICAASILQLGYAVARYNALIEGRTIERDVVYSLAGVVAVSSVYGGVALFLYQTGQASFLTLALLLAMAIITHSLFEGSRAALDRLFYQSQLQQLRANLRLLAREAGTSAALSDRLQTILLNLCRNLNIAKGFIVLRSGDVFVVQATKDAEPVGQMFPLSQFACAEIAELRQPDADGSGQMGLLVPLWAGDDQIGALLLGVKPLAQAYTEAEIELLDVLSDQMATVSYAAQQQEMNAQAINQMVTDFRTRERQLQHQIQQLMAVQQEARPVPDNSDREAFASAIERCLQQLYDYAFLGEHPFAHLALVERALAKQRLDRDDQTSITKLDRGRTLHDILVQALDKLRPQGTEPNRYEAPPRQWHPYIVLHDSYVRHELTRDVMNRLYISEATFHRIRRRAVRTIADVLFEMEQEAQQAAQDGPNRHD
jgi:hypothetical protein